jgi:hypothetical protein
LFMIDEYDVLRCCLLSFDIVILWYDMNYLCDPYVVKMLRC